MTTVTPGMGQGPAGPAGATGATGAQGPQGVATANGVTITAVNLGLSTLLTGTELHVLAVMPT